MYSPVKKTYHGNVTIQEMNDDLVLLHIPALLFVLICIIIGFIGNLFVLVTYKNNFRRSNHRYFILFLGALDFVACTAGMPYLVASLSLPYLMSSSALCKSMRYISYVVNNSSGLLLLVISIERYRKICHPFKKQISSKQTLYLCCGTILFSAILAIPAGLLYGASTIHTGVGNITGYQCYMDDNLKDPLLFEIYQGVLMIETILCIIIFAVLYTFIIRKLLTTDQFRQAMRSMQIGSANKTGHQETSFSTDYDREERDYDSCGSSCPTSQMKSKDSANPLLTNGNHINEASDVTGEEVEKSASCMSVNTGSRRQADHRSQSRVKSEKSLWRVSRELFKRKDDLKQELKRAQSDITLNRTKKKDKFNTLTPNKRLVLGQLMKSKRKPDETKKTQKPKSTTARVTLMLFTVSVVFAISFVPHLTLMIFTAEKKDLLKNMSEEEVMVYQVFLRSFILNNVANPVIYFICDSKFRQLCMNCGKRRPLK